MTVFAILTLAVLQGLTEFLPVSSSGHLVLAQEIFGMDDPAQRMAVAVLLHLGSLAAILVYYFRDFLKLFTTERRNLLFVVVGTLPAVVVVLILKLCKVDVSGIFSSPLLVGCALMVNAVFLWCSETYAREGGALTSWQKALAIGGAQVAGIIPGISRSGSTIGTGLLLGVRAADAVRFSFFLGAVAIFGAGVLEARDSFRGQVDLPLLPILLGVITSFAVSWAAIRVVALLAERKKLRWFGAYCAVAGLTAVGFVLFSR